MKHKNKSILLICIISSFLIMSAYSPLYCTTSNALQVTSPVPTPTPPSLEEHKQTINQFIEQLRLIQNRTFQLIYLALDNPIKDLPNFETTLNLINNDAATLRTNVLNYQTTIPNTSTQYRDILLILNALNYSKNALFQLESLSKAATNVERAVLLEDFFNSRLKSIEALNIIQNIISES